MPVSLWRGPRPFPTSGCDLDRPLGLARLFLSDLGCLGLHLPGTCLACLALSLSVRPAPSRLFHPGPRTKKSCETRGTRPIGKGGAPSAMGEAARGAEASCRWSMATRPRHWWRPPGREGARASKRPSFCCGAVSALEDREADEVGELMRAVAPLSALRLVLGGDYLIEGEPAWCCLGCCARWMQHPIQPCCAACRGAQLLRA